MKLIFTLLIFFAPTAFASGGHGGLSGGDGGQGVTCGKHDGGPKTAELLDLYEARRLYGFQPEFIKSNDNTTDDYYIQKSLKLAESRLVEAVGQQPEFKQLFKYLDEVQDINFNQLNFVDFVRATGDAGPMLLALPDDCQLRQFAVFKVGQWGFPSIRVVGEYWDLMPAVDNAALLIHEIFHYYFTNDPDTRALRQFTMYLTAPDDFRARNLQAFRSLFYSRQALDPHEFH